MRPTGEGKAGADPTPTGWVNGDGATTYDHHVVYAISGTGHFVNPAQIIRWNLHDLSHEVLMPSQGYDQYLQPDIAYPWLVYRHEYYSGPNIDSFYGNGVNLINLETGERTSLWSITGKEGEFDTHRPIYPATDGRYVVWLQYHDMFGNGSALWVLWT